MTAIQDTAYPRLRSSLSIHELARIYTPTSDELAFARRTTRGPVARICFLVLLKTFQRLGYFMPLTDVPSPIVQHIADRILRLRKRIGRRRPLARFAGGQPFAARLVIDIVFVVVAHRAALAAQRGLRKRSVNWSVLPRIAGSKTFAVRGSSGRL